MSGIKSIVYANGISDTFKVNKDINAPFENQYFDFETNILKNLNQLTVKSYANAYLGLVEETENKNWDCDFDISDLPDNIILQEAGKRGFASLLHNIITADYQARFLRIIEAQNLLQTENILQELEKDLNLVQ